MVVAGQPPAQHTARETWRKSWVTRQLWDLIAVGLKGKTKNYLDSWLPQGGKTRQEAEPPFLQQLSND